MHAIKINQSGKIVSYQLKKVTEKSIENLKKGRKKGQKTYRINKDRIKNAGAWLSYTTKRVWVLTLTTKFKETELIKVNDALNVYLNNLRTNYRLKKYVGVMEFQKNGNIHYHILADFGTERINIEKLNGAWCKALSTAMQELYYEPNALRVGGITKQGKRYYYITNAKHAVAYLTKYISKGTGVFNSKCYYISTSLSTEPIRLVGDDADFYYYQVSQFVSKIYATEYCSIVYIDAKTACEIIDDYVTNYMYN